MHPTTSFRPSGAAERLAGLAAAVLLLPAAAGAAVIPAPGAPNFTLTAREGRVITPEGGSLYSWGYAASDGPMQYPGPTLIVNEGDTVTVTLSNALPVAAGNVSIVFPGQEVTAEDGVAGLLTREAPPGGSVAYSFQASRPGTFAYHSGSRPELQVEMGLTGALIVRPAGFDPGAPQAYGHAGTAYDREYLFLLSEMDVDIHNAVEEQLGGPGPIEVATEPYDPEYWFINGRAAPDTMAMPGTTSLPNQPYNCMPRMLPGERLLMRIVGGGRDLHSFHHHGNHARVLARDGNLLASGPSLVGPTLFTITPVPGGTADAIFEWTGKGLGWDIYGHTATDGSSCTPDANGYDLDTDGAGLADTATREWCADHTRKIPVQLPEGQNLTIGGFWSGSPYMGTPGSIPPGQGGLNPSSGYTYMWHSHVEREMVNNDVFPGGMMTMLVVEPPGTSIEE
jgi:FtsP/CotA-like multicopper oxidase with cupredoxin domain